MVKTSSPSENFEVTIECEEDGTIKFFGSDSAVINECRDVVNQINGQKLVKTTRQLLLRSKNTERL